MAILLIINYKCTIMITTNQNILLTVTPIFNEKETCPGCGCVCPCECSDCEECSPCKDH